MLMKYKTYLLLPFLSVCQLFSQVTDSTQGGCDYRLYCHQQGGELCKNQSIIYTQPLYLCEGGSLDLNFNGPSGGGCTFGSVTWFKNGNIISVTNGPYLTITAPGTYSANFINSNYMPRSTCEVTVICSIMAGISTNEDSKDYLIYPTLAHQKINIKHPPISEPLNIQLLDINTSLIPITFIENNGILTLNTSSIQSGLYLLIISQKSGKFKKFKIIIDHNQD